MRSIRLLALVAPARRDWVGTAARILEQGGPPGFTLAEVTDPAAGEARDAAICLEGIRRVQPDVILVSPDPARPGRVQEVVRAARAVSPELPVWVVADETDPKPIIELLDCGVRDFLTLPLKAVELLPRLTRLRPCRTKPPPLPRALREKLGLKDFVGESPAFLAALNRIPTVAQCDANVLITGETGTGKELCARAVHYLSPRSHQPFVPVNCGAIPVELVENHLFGHEQGAYTGAHAAAPGLFRAADGGTVLLDEVDALPLAAQVKLLRFLQEKQFQPLGASRSCTVDLRIVAACNGNLEEAVRAGRFRQDLYYRLSVIPIQLPPLRQRREDIPPLARHFLRKYAEQFRKPAVEFDAGALQKLVAHDWPGNVRELENVVERAVILTEHPTLRGEDMLLCSAEEACRPESFKRLKAEAVAQFERTYLQQLLCAHHGNITKASLAAKKDRRAFWQLMRKHNLVVSAAMPAA